jgi:ABC-type multidrug transport system fused ATPase/permease subunit
MYIIVVAVGAAFMLLPEGNPARISIADYTAYLMFVTTLLTSVRRIVEFAEQFQLGMSGIERFQEIMDTEPDITDAKNAQPLENVKGKVEFSDVSFHYETETRNVLTHLNLTVSPGESIALVGPSGGGKTTLCSLIPRFYEVSSGSILIDGYDIKDVTLTSLRSSIGVVQQDVYLFSGSVKENISYGKIDATFDEIVEKYVEMNVAHPFREGNGRATRIWLDHILKVSLGVVVDWQLVDKEDYLLAMERSPIKDVEIKHLLRRALTDKTRDRLTFMKGLDSSYHYEGYTSYRAQQLRGEDTE